MSTLIAAIVGSLRPAASSSGPTLIQVVSASSLTLVASLSATLTSVQAGDLIVVEENYSGTAPTWTFNATDSGGNTYSTLLNAIGGGGATDIYTWSASASANVPNLVVTVKVTGHNINGLLTVYQLRGGAVVAANCVNKSLTSIQPAGTNMTSPAFNVSSGGIIIAPASIYISSSSPTFNPITPSAGTYSPDSSLTFSSSVNLYVGHVYGTGAQTGMTITWTPNPTTLGWRGTAVVIPVNP